MLLSSYLTVLTALVTVTVAMPMPAPPKLSIDTKNVPANRPPTPNYDWPKTITDGERRQRHGSESPTLLPGSPIGDPKNYQPGQHKHNNSPASGH